LAIQAGDELTVAYLPDRPTDAVVVVLAEDGRTGPAEPLGILIGFAVLLVAMAGIAFVGVAILQAYAEGPSGDTTWMQP
jgi:hypothetical protein